MEVFRVVLLGKRGAGKSSAGNILLGGKHFHTEPNSQGVTQACSMSSSVVDGHKLCVVDTPGWPDIWLTESETTKNIIKCVDIADPGPHVLLLVLPNGHFTTEEIEMAEQILEVFGEEASKYMMVLFTKGDAVEENTIEKYLTSDHPDLKQFIEVCGGRYHVFSNRHKEDHTQVSTLLEKIKAMVERNEGRHYTKAMLQNTAEQRGANSDVESNDVSAIRESVEGVQHGEGRDEFVVHVAKSRGEKPRGEKATGEKSLHHGAKSENQSKVSHKMELKWQKAILELQKSVERVETTWRKEKNGLEKEVRQLRMKVGEQKMDLDKVKKELQQQQAKADAFEKLRQDSQRQGEELEKLRREFNEERARMRRKSFTPQKSVDEFEKAINTNKRDRFKNNSPDVVSAVKEKFNSK